MCVCVYLLNCTQSRNPALSSLSVCGNMALPGDGMILNRQKHRSGRGTRHTAEFSIRHETAFLSASPGGSSYSCPVDRGRTDFVGLTFEKRAFGADILLISGMRCCGKHVTGHRNDDPPESLARAQS